MINRVLAKINMLHTWEYPRRSFNYMLLLGACGTALAVTPPRWIFLACVVGKFTPGEAMTKKIKVRGREVERSQYGEAERMDTNFRSMLTFIQQGVALTFARRYLDPPDEADDEGDAPR